MFVLKATLVLATVGVWTSAILLVFGITWYIILAIATVLQVAFAITLASLKAQRSKTPGR